MRRTRRLRYLTLVFTFTPIRVHLGNKKYPVSPCLPPTYFLEFTHVPLFRALQEIRELRCTLARILCGMRKSLELNPVVV